MTKFIAPGTIDTGVTLAAGEHLQLFNVAVSSTSPGTGNPGGSGGPHAPFTMEIDDTNLFIDTYDPALYIGYNAGVQGTKVTAAEPSLTYVIEGDYNDGTAHKSELYAEYYSPDSTIHIRPFFFQFDRSQSGVGNTNKALSGMAILGNPFVVGSPDRTINFRVSPLDSLALPGQINFFPTTTIAGGTILTVNAKTGSASQISMRVNDADIFYFSVSTTTSGKVSVAGQDVMAFYKTGSGGSTAINVFNDNSSALIVKGGAASGANTQGSIVARASAAQTASLFEAQDENSVAHIRITAGTVAKTASLVVGKAVLANAATDGFLYLPTMAGTPTSAPPTAQTGTAPFVYDTTAHKLWVYDTAWKGVVLA